MPKDFHLGLLVQDLVYTVAGTFVHEFLFRVCPPRPGLTVLEPGCGCGKFGLSYGIKGAEGTLFDIDLEVVEYASRLKHALDALLGKPLRMGIQMGDIFHEMKQLPEYFDLVMNEGVPQHWPDAERRQGCLNLMTRVTRPGGTVVVIGNNGLNAKEQEIDRTFSFTYQGMPPTRKCFTPDELKTRMELASLREVKVEPLNGSWSDAILFVGWGVK